MAITNRNIAADANIDLSKINLAGGRRAMWEDFDETPSSTNIADLYGFDAHLSGGTALVSNTVNSCGALLTTGGAFKSMIFGGEGVFFARLRGPGKVWVQSLPFSRLAGRMLAAAGSRGGQNRGEGSILGGLGDLLDGD